MRQTFFDYVLEDTLRSIKHSLGVKAKEYVRHGNPMHNFDTGALKTKQIREKVIRGFALKHEISIDDMRDDLLSGKLPTEATVNEKFNDLINYLILEKASFLDRIADRNDIVISVDDLE
jgi:hypothetical protein